VKTKQKQRDVIIIIIIIIIPALPVTQLTDFLAQRYSVCDR